MKAAALAAAFARRTITDERCCATCRRWTAPADGDIYGACGGLAIVRERIGLGTRIRGAKEVLPDDIWEPCRTAPWGVCSAYAGPGVRDLDPDRVDSTPVPVRPALDRRPEAQHPADAAQLSLFGSVVADPTTVPADRHRPAALTIRGG